MVSGPHVVSEYDPLRRRLAGNHPLAGSHIGLIMTAPALTQNGQFARSG